MIANLTFLKHFYKHNFGCFRLFILACARAHAGQSEHDSECLNKVFIAYIMNYIL